MARKKLGAILESKGVITEFQLVAALSHQRKWKIRLGKALLELGYIEERKLFEVLSDQWGMELVDLYEITILDDIKRRLSREKGTTLMAFPIRIEGDDIVVAISEPDRENIKAELDRLFGMPVKLVLATDSQIEEFTRTLPEKVSVASVKPVKKAFRKNENGDIEPVEDKDVILGADKPITVKEVKKSEPIDIPDMELPAEPAPVAAPAVSADSDEPIEMVETVETDEITLPVAAAPQEPVKEPAPAGKMEGLAVDVPDLVAPETKPEKTTEPALAKAEEPWVSAGTPEPPKPVTGENTEEPWVSAGAPEPPKPGTGEDTDEFWDDANVATAPEVPLAEKESEAAPESEHEPEAKAAEDFFPGQMKTFEPEALGEDSSPEPAAKSDEDFFPGQMKMFEPEALEKESETKSEEEPVPQPETEPELKPVEEVEEIGMSDTGEPVELKEKAPPETEKQTEQKEEVSLPPLHEIIAEHLKPAQEPQPETVAGPKPEPLASEPAPFPEPVSAEEIKMPGKTLSDAEKQMAIKKIEDIEQQMQNLTAMVAELRKKIHP